MVSPYSFRRMKLKLKQALLVASVAALAASSQAVFNYSTGFESSEGFSVGNIDGQNGYTVFTAAANGPVIASNNPNGGNQHLQLGYDPGAPLGTSNGVFSEEFDTTGADIYTLSFDLAIGDTGGADYFFVGQDTVAGFLSFYVNFSYLGNIQVVDGGTWTDTGVAWNIGDYTNLTIIQDFAAGTSTYLYGGNEIYSSAIWNTGALGVNQFVLFSDNFHLNEVADIDNLTFTGEAVPEPMTMGVLGAGLAAAALARRKRK